MKKTYEIMWYAAPTGTQIGPQPHKEHVTGSKKRVTEYAKSIAAEREWFLKWIEPITEQELAASPFPRTHIA